MNVLDLFCGAGGLSLGFKLAGFNIYGGIDHDKDAIDTHHENFPNCLSMVEDIKEITEEKIIELFSGKVDVIIGGPPCQGFSSANMWQKDMQDERNKLFFEYIRFIKTLKPKAFLIENVRGILTKNNGYAKEKIYEIATELGYSINSNVLIASDFGVPQHRSRAFFVAIRNDINKVFDFDKLQKREKVNVKEAISDLYKESDIDYNTNLIKVEPLSRYQKIMRKRSNDLIYNHEIKFPNQKVRDRMDHVPQGGNWRHVPEHLWDTQRSNRHSSAYRRLDEGDCSVTIDTGHMNYFHPLYNRVPTVRESARLQSFPDDFIFKGTRGSQFRQVGNAVPPLLSQAIAESIYEILREWEVSERIEY